MTKYTTVIFFMLAFGIICYANFFTNSHAFSPAYALYPDSINLYYLNGLSDNSLFPNDPLLAYLRHNLNYFLPESICFNIYLVFVLIFSLPLGLTILSILLITAAVVAVYKIGACLLGKDYGFLLSGLFLIYFLSMDTFYSANLRSFGALLFCFFLLCLIKNKFIMLTFFIPLAVIFYPYLIPTLILATLAVLLFSFHDLTRLKIYKKYLFALLFSFGIAFVFWRKSVFLRSAFNDFPFYGYYKYLDWSGLLINLREPLSVISNFLFNINEHSRLYIYFTQCLGILSAIFVLVFRRSAFLISKAVWLVFVSSLISFLLIYPFDPFTASRQVVFSVPMLLVFFVSFNTHRLLSRYKTGHALFVLIPAMVIFVIFHPRFNDIVDYRKYKLIYDYVKKLPKNTLLAGFPKSQLIEAMPLFSKRTIFFCDEFAGLWKLVYKTADLNNRKSELMDVLYTSSLERINSFASKYNIDYFLIESYAYNYAFFNALTHFISSKDKLVYDAVKGNIGNANFSLLGFAKNNYDFKDNVDGYDVFIVSTKKLKNKLK